jgi:Na+:H+ antiporter, NhaA family
MNPPKKIRLTRLFSDFFESEKAGGILLLLATLLSLLLANSPIQQSYTAFWDIHLGSHSIGHWINDGLMAIFFLLIGLELERELYGGELADVKQAALPAMAALGGMLMPVALYLLLNLNSGMRAGAAIPMATDIAFAFGILSLVGNKVPVALKIFLTALAVIDDLGAILVIAFFYTGSIAWMWLLGAVGFFVAMLVLNRLKVHNLIPYIVGGVGLWYCMLHSGVHATIAGVLTAFALPYGSGGKKSPSYLLQHFLHRPVAFVILPVFALANTAIPIPQGWQNSITSNGSLGIITGLVLGKPLGILLFSFLGVALGFCKLPEGVSWKQIAGAGLLGGIGFTMSIFISLLAFDLPQDITMAKMAIMIASVIAGILGYGWLKYSLRNY